MAKDDNGFFSSAPNKDQEEEVGCLLDTSQRQRMQAPQCLFVPIFLMKINDLQSGKEGRSTINGNPVFTVQR